MRITVVYLLSVALGCNGVTAPANPAPRPTIVESPTEETEENPMLTAVLLAATLAAPGDVIYIVNPGEVIVGRFVPAPPVILDFAQKQELASAVASTFPGIKPATLDQYTCWANAPMLEDKKAVDVSALAASLPWPCHAVDGDASDVTDEEALDLELESDGMCGVIDVPTTHFKCQRPSMDVDAKTLNDAFTQSVYGQPLNLVYFSQCTRNQEDDTEIACDRVLVKIAPLATWRADRKIRGMVRGLLGRVAP